MIKKEDFADFYLKNGYVMPIDAIPKNEITTVAEKYKALWAYPPKEINHPWALKTHLLADWVFNLATHNNILNAIETIIGPDIMIQAADTFIKPPKSNKIVNWHQDANYWGLDPFEIITAWIAITDVFPENGCMRYLPNTHLQNKLTHQETFSKDSQLTRGQEIAMEIREEEAINVELKAGQISLHHCLLAHASGPNLTNEPRIGLAVRYIAPHVRQTNGPPMSTILVRGKDEFGNFKHDIKPNSSFDSACIDAHDRSCAPHKEFNYSTA